MKKVFLLLITFILVRSLNFTPSLNFSTDPARFSTKALEIYRNRSLVLIGPTFSINYNGRYAFQGSVIYYFQLVFLLLGGFDPVRASFAFMVFCALMTIPLYMGVKLLANERTAILMVIIYTMFPLYINYTKFLWNPNFQLSLLPVLIFLMGLFREKKQKVYLYVTGVTAGIIVQFHYQFLAIILGMGIYYLVSQKDKFKATAVLAAGVITGFLPIIIFELRHNFYNLRTVLMFFQYSSGVGNAPARNLNDYYFLSLSFMGLVLLGCLAKNFRWPLKKILIILTAVCIKIYIPEPMQGFRMAKDWKYTDELKAYRIIKSENRDNFNITNLVYDTKAETQKYFLIRDKIRYSGDDYETNKYLFVISPGNSYPDDPAYEVHDFKPAKILKSWKINDEVNMYLAERVSGV